MNVRLGSFVSGISLRTVRSESVPWELSAGSHCLCFLLGDIRSGNFSLLGELSLDHFCLGAFGWELAIGISRLGTFAWELSSGVFNLDAPLPLNW